MLLQYLHAALTAMATVQVSQSTGLNFILSLQVAVPDVVEAAKEADILVFVVPHQFIRTLCSTLLGKIKPTAVGLSLIKVCSLEVLVM
jgi:glycerol-3-phosphate dehydrogenase